MTVCTVCFHAVPPGLTSCIACGSDVEPESEETAELEPRWVIVRTFSAEYQARFVAGRLIANGVPACVLSQVDSTRGFTVGALAVAKVFVPEAYVDEANQILAMPGLEEEVDEEMDEEIEGGVDEADGDSEDHDHPGDADDSEDAAGREGADGPGPYDRRP